jgi:vacuolar-type H+-ATPase subunit I/STV1
MTIGIGWMILCAKHWREILMVQHFISGVIFFLMIEMAFNWGYWDNYNKNDASCMSPFKSVTLSLVRQGSYRNLQFANLILLTNHLSYAIACDHFHLELWPQ